MKKLNNFIKSRAFIITLTLAFIALIIVGVTYAWFTWTSTDNTNITMQIGQYTTVTFTGGNAINVNNLAPVYNYTDGESTTFSLTNNNSNQLKEFKYNVYLDITSIANELKSTLLKYVLLDGSSNIVDQGNFSAAENGSTLTITENKALPNGTSSYTFIIYLDGNEPNTNMINKSITGSLRVTVIGSEIDLTLLHVTTADDYEYTLFDKEDTEYDVDYILLTKYIGIFPNIQVPNTMTVNDKVYKTVLYCYPAQDGTFARINSVTDVILPSEYLASEYANNKFNPVNNLMQYLFYNCTSLVSVPTIPSSVTNMNATFYGCTSLVNAPAIPNSVTYMPDIFRGCTSLVTAPEIPSSVTIMAGAFHSCTNLEGTVRINSTSAAGQNGNCWNNTYYGYHPFYGTSKAITVEVPADSTTYTNMNRAKPANVTVTTFTPE